MIARALLVVIVLLGSGAAQARQGSTVWQSGDVSLNLWGSLRQIFRYGDQTDSERFQTEVLESLPAPTCFDAALFKNCPAFDVVGKRDAWQGLTRLRLGAELQLTSQLSATVVYDNELLYGILDTFESELGRGLADRDTFLGAEGQITQSQHLDWTHRLYRGFLRVETEKVDFIIGRQRIAWGVARLWNPIDRFSAIPPLAIEGDQVLGMDAIDAKWLYDGFSFLELVYSPGTSRDRARYAARLHGVLFDADLSLMGGVFQKAPTVGVDFARNLGGAAARFELVWTKPKLEVWRLDEREPAPPDDFWQLVVSVDGTVDIGSGITLLFEYLYNGNALGFGSGKAGSLLPLFESAPAATSPFPLPAGSRAVTNGSVDLFGSSRVVSGGRHLTGFQASYDLLPELSLSGLIIYDWEGHSAAFFPSIRYSPLDFMEITFGVQLFAGGRRSEYGDAQNQVYLLADFFF